MSTFLLAFNFCIFLKLSVCSCLFTSVRFFSNNDTIAGILHEPRPERFRRQEKAVETSHCPMTPLASVDLILGPR